MKIEGIWRRKKFNRIRKKKKKKELKLKKRSKMLGSSPR